ncbi:MAG: GNAT family N-acetyltransferase, partial [Candidatus Micrarchaeota archaeon]
IVVLVIVLSALVTSFGVSYYEWKFKDSFLFKRELTLKDGRKVVLRTITRDDFPKMRQFLNALVREGALIARDRYLNPIEEKDMERESLDKINRGDAITWVCEYEKRIIARAVAKRMDLRERDNVDLSLYVAKDFRGVGLGTTLLRMLIKESQLAFKPHKIYLSAYSNNLKAIRLYEKEGFEKIGVLPEWGKYHGEYIDEIYLAYRPQKKRSAGKR